MKKMRKNGGFSLIELLVVMGIIAVLSSIVTPKFRGYTAKGKETKALAVLESLRTASELYFLEEGKSFVTAGPDGYGEITKEQLEKLEDYLSNNMKTLIKEDDSVAVEIGGSRTEAEGEITYGGEIGFTTKGTGEDGVKIWFAPDNTIGEYNLNGDKWIDL